MSLVFMVHHSIGGANESDLIGGLLKFFISKRNIRRNICQMDRYLLRSLIMIRPHSKRTISSVKGSNYFDVSVNYPETCRNKGLSRFIKACEIIFLVNTLSERHHRSIP